jgi:hypothetical protein
MPGELNEEGIDVPANLELSDLDKAFIMLNYPGKASADMSVLQALKVAGVSREAAAKISDYISTGMDSKKKDSDRAAALTAAREEFIAYNKSVMELTAGKSHYNESPESKT